MASLRSNSSAATPGKAKNSSKGKKKKKQHQKCSDSSETETAIQSPTATGAESKRRPSGSEVPDKKPRCEDPVREDCRRPFHRNLYDSCYDGNADSNEAIVEAAPKSGNYHAQIAPHRKFCRDEDEECRDFDVVVVGGGANPVSIGKIDCISYGASELILPSPLLIEGQVVGGSDCDLVLCDEILLDEHPQHQKHDGNNNGIVNSAALIDQHQTTEGIMGANVSRHHEKGLTGRRAQSTGEYTVFPVYHPA